MLFDHVIWLSGSFRVKYSSIWSIFLAASEEAPVLGGEAQEEKKVIVGDEKLFEERLAEIKR